MNPAPVPAQVSSVDSQLTWALGRRVGVSVVRSDALLVSSDKANPDVLAKVRAAIRAGEDHYMGFQFAPAAAALSEAGNQLQEMMGLLDAEQLKLLRRAQLLAGSSWAEAKRGELAVTSFLEVQARAGAASLDMSLVSPKAQPFWQQAANRLRARGTASVAMESEPTGAEVYLDGELRGRTPLLLNQVPLGAHHLTLRTNGYDAVQQALQVAADTPRQRFLMAERPAIAALKRTRHACSHGGALDDVLQNDVRTMASTSNVQAVVVVGVLGGDGARVVLQRFARGGALTHSVVVSLDNLERLLPDALDVLLGPTTAAVGLPSEALNGLDLPHGLLGQAQAPRVAAPALRMDFGELAEQSHGPWQSVSVWAGVGTPVFKVKGFGPEYRVAVNSSWGGQISLFDAQLDYAYSEQRNVVSLNNLGGSVGARARWQVGRFQLGGGLLVGAEAAIQRAPTAFDGLRVQATPHVTAQLRVDVEVAPQMFVGLTGYARGQAMRVQEAAGVQWQYPLLQYGGLLGVGWSL